jgi:hypothetical protein
MFRLRVFENRVLRRIFGPKRDEVTGDWRKLHNEELHNLYGAELFLRSRQLCSHSRTSQHFMELEGSIPCSQEPSTGHYPKPYPFNPLHSILSL